MARYAALLVPPALIALAYAALVWLVAGTPLVDWAPIVWSRTKSVGPALLLIAPIALMATMIRDGRAGRARSSIAICRDFVATRIVPGSGLPFLMPLLSAVVTGTAYMIYKQQVLPRTGFGADRLLANMDRALLGTDAWTLSHRLFPDATATWMIDLAYHSYFFPMTFGIAIAMMLPLNSVARYRYMIGYSLLLIGPATVGSWLIPGVGPCFDLVLHHADRYAPLMSDLAGQQAELGRVLTSLDNQNTLVTLFTAGDLADGAGISAMPSIHNALSTLFICFVISLRPKLAWVTVPYGALILIGSVHLGWHYAVDSIAGIALAWLVWIATGPIAHMVGVGAVETPPRESTRIGALAF